MPCAITSSESVSDLEDGLDEARVDIAAASKDETLVDFDDVGREVAQVGQGGVSGAEVVDGDAYSEVAQCPDVGGCGLGVGDEGALGDLQNQGGRGKPVSCRTCRTVPGKLRSLSCMPETLTATLSASACGTVSCQCRPWRQASRSTQAPMGRIR